MVGFCKHTGTLPKKFGKQNLSPVLKYTWSKISVVGTGMISPDLEQASSHLGKPLYKLDLVPL